MAVSIASNKISFEMPRSFPIHLMPQSAPDFILILPPVFSETLQPNVLLQFCRRGISHSLSFISYFYNT